MATKYTVQFDGVDTDITRSKKETAVALATQALRDKKAYVVTVRTDAGTEVFKAARRKITKFTKPYTKVVVLKPEHQALVPEGYDAAYERPRNGAVVLRIADQDIVEHDELYAVLDTVTGVLVDYAPTTRAAGQIMKALPKARVAS
jgi:hypothetical protein